MLEFESHSARSPSSLTDDIRENISGGMEPCHTERTPVHYGRVWSPERDEQLIRLRLAPERWTDRQIADAMGIETDQVRARVRVLKPAGITVKRAPLPPGRHAYTQRDLSGGDVSWPDAALDELARLWDEGLSTSQIGLRMGRSKNSIVGKAHRLDLPSRPSPIQRDGEAAPRQHVARVRPAASTLPPLASAMETESDSPIHIVASPVRIRPVAPARVVALPLPRPPPAPLSPRPYGRIVECCWPIGEPGTREFRFCSDPSDPGRPYCEPHSRTAFARPPRAKPKDDGYARLEVHP